MSIFCENDLCLYWKQDHCILDTVHISLSGICEDCILITFPEKLKDSLRSEQILSL